MLIFTNDKKVKFHLMYDIVDNIDHKANNNITNICTTYNFRETVKTKKSEN